MSVSGVKCGVVGRVLTSVFDNSRIGIDSCVDNSIRSANVIGPMCIILLFVDSYVINHLWWFHALTIRGIQAQLTMMVVHYV